MSPEPTKTELVNDRPRSLKAVDANGSNLRRESNVVDEVISTEPAKAGRSNNHLQEAESV
jgi:hypothetical protein